MIDFFLSTGIKREYEIANQNLACRHSNVIENGTIEFQLEL